MGSVAGVLKLAAGKGLSGSIKVPSDKSIAHRAILFAALADGESQVRAFTLGRDNLASIRIMQSLGVPIEGTLPPSIESLIEEEGLINISAGPSAEAELQISGRGLKGLIAPKRPLDCGNSGTSARLLCGLLSGQSFSSELSGDESLSRRPFKRVVEPLSKMGAEFSSEMLPLVVRGGALRGMAYQSPRASAQVKSAILLAGLYADGPVVVTEPSQSRDHTERMLQAMGAPVVCRSTHDSRWQVELEHQVESLKPLQITVPGDFSAAGFFLVAGSIIKNSELRLEGIGCNPSRTGLLDLLLRMGANISIENKRDVAGEPVCDLVVQSSRLSGVQVGARDVVLAIDEIPIFCIAAAVAQGETVITGAEELRVKESDRLAVMASLLRSFGVEVEEYADGMRIQGLGSAEATQSSLNSAWRRSGDHRIAMSGTVLELCICGESKIFDLAAIETSFPRFVETFQMIT